MNLEALYKEAETDSLSEQVAFCKLIDSWIEENQGLEESCFCLNINNEWN